MRYCPQCKTEKPDTSFSPKGRQCRPCVTERKRKSTNKIRADRNSGALKCTECGKGWPETQFGSDHRQRKCLWCAKHQPPQVAPELEAKYQESIDIVNEICDKMAPGWKDVVHDYMRENGDLYRDALAWYAEKERRAEALEAIKTRPVHYWVDRDTGLPI